MENKNQKISACLVTYNEEKVIRQCLSNLVGLADEIIVVHDGECTDRTIKIAKEFTNKIFVRPHVGVADEHRPFALRQATGNWILRVDPDEFFEKADQAKIHSLVANATVDGYIFKWECWNGKEPVYFKGLQKMCLFRKSTYSFIGIPHQSGDVNGIIESVNITLHHRPAYNNILWKSFFRKTKSWVPVHAKYFFPELVKTYECFNRTADDWVVYATRVRKNIFFYLAFEPLKVLLGQLKNGLWTSRIGVSLALQQYVTYFLLFWQIWKMDRKLNK